MKMDGLWTRVYNHKSSQHLQEKYPCKNWWSMDLAVNSWGIKPPEYVGLRDIHCRLGGNLAPLRPRGTGGFFIDGWLVRRRGSHSSLTRRQLQIKRVSSLNLSFLSEDLLLGVTLDFTLWQSFLQFSNTCLCYPSILHVNMSDFRKLGQLL